ncbi:uncharacterized protein ACLA_054610 [Aspergillus clavatus NRRL 1]|uniref:DUF7907 domain-containing protein n=1 Tax=Aspergillus clavatus (strain ATCC 1007 / CBS 513.65 / DSM 816 / NCTC 3887 / NRRL 1 / QM 1276 / 107) TaxID=344612 RepID=A1C990_ASPCL|nr:uncharacterized protein ACLA_054610 [Aspergillus clavatus NRRL 1]EAW13414.1 conserved hypothetical protein [Aspergillus clavatus NRRL 1]
MKLFSTLALLVSAVAATPVTTHTSRDAEPSKPFYLKTSGAANAKHNDLYVYAYHTGAGFNDAVLTPDVKSASKASLNGTYVQFDLNTPFPWGMYTPGVTNYAQWAQVGINTGYGDEDFSINQDGLQWSEEKGFGGWLVCDWYHGAPQLFYIYRYYEPVIPSSCDAVKLQVEYL